MSINKGFSSAIWLRLGLGCGLAIVTSTVVSIAQPGPTPQPSCYKTENIGKCGTDRNENPVACGSSTCYLLSYIYGNAYNCISGGTAGLKACGAGQCKETVITRVCEPNGMCRVVSPESHDVIPTSFASGAACSSSGPVDPN